ncbi:MAG: UxaA family hydrolase [Nostocoides sp.]
MASSLVPAILLLDADDGVAIAARYLAAGERVDLPGGSVVLSHDVPLGFKLAATDMDRGTTIIRAGVPIGQLTEAVATGDLVHTHNLESLYLRTHARGEE